MQNIFYSINSKKKIIELCPVLVELKNYPDSHHKNKLNSLAISIQMNLKP